MILAYLFSSNANQQVWPDLVQSFVMLSAYVNKKVSSASIMENKDVLQEEKNAKSEDSKEVQDMIESAMTGYSSAYVKLNFAMGKQRTGMELVNPTALADLRGSNQEALDAVVSSLNSGVQEVYAALIEGKAAQ